MTGTRRQERIWEYLRETGRPTLLRYETPEVQWAVSKIRSFNVRGMSLSAMGRQVGLAEDAITRLLREERPGIRRSTFEKIRRIEFDDQEGQLARVPLLGSQRRLRALRADGYPYTFLAEQLGMKRNSPVPQRILTGDKKSGGGRPVQFLIAFTARNIERLYEKLSVTDPVDMGVTPPGAAYARNRAAKLGYAPSSCWDPDTIDDPEAIPEWTGKCGTPEGHRIHKRDGIPMCAACESKGQREPYPGFDGELLRRLREKKGLTRPALAALAPSVNPATIQYWENGRSKPARQGKLDEVLSALDATLDDVTTKEDQPDGR